MPDFGEIKEDIAFTANLNSLVSAYEEIAVMRIQRIRDSVLAARLFHERLANVFTEVQSSNALQVAAALKKREQALRGKNAVVLLSSNTRLSGAITANVSRHFLKHADLSGSDVIIIGQVGKEHIQSVRPDATFTFFPLPEGTPDMHELRPIIKTLLQYHTVTVYFGHFENLLNQRPATVQLGVTESTQQRVEKAEHEKTWFSQSTLAVSYIFEPSIEQVVTYFNDQIFAALIKQTADESWLSLLGSRITAMEQASQNISDRLSKLRRDERRIYKRVQNKKQQETLAGMSLWRK